jgi:hypothetical protein
VQGGAETVFGQGKRKQVNPKTIRKNASRLD